MPSYLRGTDLLNCFGICDNFRCDSYPMGAELSCLAKPSDICPREQADNRYSRNPSSYASWREKWGHTNA